MVAPEERGGSAASDEETLIRRARTDPAAFGELYHRYLDRVYAYVRARTSNEADAPDLTQQIFVCALEALPTYRGRAGTFPAWLFRIARNTLVDSHRRRRPSVSWDYMPWSVHPAGEGSPEADLLRREALSRLRTLVYTLSEEQQELLALRFAARLTVAEIAGVIGKSEAATQRQIHRIVQRLKEQYHDDAE